MSQVNADSVVLCRIQSRLNNLWSVADKGFSSCLKAIEDAKQQARCFYGQMKSKILQLLAEADRLERTADAEQQEYDRQVKEMKEGKSHSIPYYSPDMKRSEAYAKRRQAQELSDALEEFRQKCKSFKDVQNRFVAEFSKIAYNGGGGGDNEQPERILEKSIEALDDYEQVSI